MESMSCLTDFPSISHGSTVCGVRSEKISIGIGLLMLFIGNDELGGDFSCDLRDLFFRGNGESSHEVGKSFKIKGMGFIVSEDTKIKNS